MIVTKCLLDGFEIVGFEIQNNKGVTKNLSYKSALVFAKQKKLDGISYRKVDNKEYLIGLDYKSIDKMNIESVEYLKLTENGVLVNIENIETEIPLYVFYNLLLNDSVIFPNLDEKEKFQLGLFNGNKCLDIK